MNPEFIKIKQSDERLYLHAESIACVSDSSIRSVNWPSAVERLVFTFARPIENEFELATGNIRQYCARINYFTTLDMLARPKEVAEPNHITAITPTELSAVRELYLKTVFETMQGRISKERLEYSRHIAANYLTLEKSLVIYNNDSPVGMTTMIAHTDHTGKPVNCINWIWFSEQLSCEERDKAHNLLLVWLHHTGLTPLNCYIDSFNIRSQKFFRKIGFKPVCLHISRNASQQA